MPNITEALDIGPHRVVGLVGGGAKTRAALNLAAELLAQGRGVVTTSTVNMSDLSLPEAFFFLVEPSLQGVVSHLPRLIQDYRHVRLASERLRADKISGIDPQWVRTIRDLPGVSNVIVEADGARHRPLKAPNATEPLLPSDVDVVFISAGLEALGEPLDERSTHRPELAQAIMGISQGEKITVGAVAGLLSGPRGGLQGIPGRARTYFLLTGWEQSNNEAALEIANKALELAPAVSGYLFMGAGHTGFTYLEQSAASG